MRGAALLSICTVRGARLALAGRGTPGAPAPGMLDALFTLAAVAFFALCHAYARSCEAL